MRSYRQDIPRAEFVRQRRSSRISRKDRGNAQKTTPAVTPRRTEPVLSRYLPVEPRTTPRPAQARSNTRSRQGYEFGFPAANARVRTPAITLPEFNMRWVSAVLTGLLLFALYTLWNSSTFKVSGIEVTGNQRLGAEEIYSTMNLDGEPIFAAVPAKLEDELRSAYHDLSFVDVKVAFPNQITVTVTERTPVLAWYYDNTLRWVDSSGVSFPPRGINDALINIVANGDPSAVAADGTPLGGNVYVAPDMVQAMLALYPYVPAGVPMVYDPQYGMGWQDPHGWQVFFGQTTQDINIKIEAYTAIVDLLVREGRQPTLVSLAYLDAPFFK